MRLLGRQSWWTAVWHFSSVWLPFFCVDTSVDFNSVQVEYTVQLHGFVFEDCRKSHFNPNPDAVPCLETLTGKTPHVVVVDGSISLCSLLSFQTQLCSHAEFVELCIESLFGARFVARSVLCCCPQSHANDVWFELLL